MSKLNPLIVSGLGLALGVGVAVGTAAQEWSQVRIATEGAYPPWNATDSSGELVGFEIDLAKDLCQRMAVECEIVAQDWEGIIPALQAGKYDVIMAGMSITDERKQVITFSKPYADTPAAFAVLGDSDLASYNGTADRIDLDEGGANEQAALDELKQALEGKTIGVQVATTHQNFVDEHLSEVVEVRRYDTQENLDLDLRVRTDRRGARRPELLASAARVGARRGLGADRPVDGRRPLWQRDRSRHPARRTRIWSRCSTRRSRPPRRTAR